MNEETQLTKKERQELKHQEKDAFKESQKRNKILKKYAVWIIFLALAGVAIYGFGSTEQQSEESISSGQDIPIQGRDHITENSPTPTYNSNPPTSGPHAGPVNGGFHDGEIKDINAVHNLEHGFIWITYKDVDDETLEELEKIGKKFSGSVVVSKRDANDSPIALASWGRLQKIDAFDEDLIVDFIKKNKNNSPERLAR